MNEKNMEEVPSQCYIFTQKLKFRNLEKSFLGLVPSVNGQDGVAWALCKIKK